jgi:hypothetical protein
MSISTVREDVSRKAVAFAWDQWSQMGVFATPQRPADAWAQDPEALLVFTLDIARDEPRLFDEVLDWLRANGSLVSGRRLTRLAAPDTETDALVRAAVAWAAKQGSPLRMGGDPPDVPAEPRMVSRVETTPLRADETFSAHAFLKSAAEPSGKSVAPPALAPINLAFRLRMLFGVGSRAEIVRYLLTADVPQTTTLAIADAAVSTKRNVNDALKDLASARAISRVVAGNEARYSIDRRRWGHFLELDSAEIPIFRDWPALLAALAEINRWLWRSDADTLGDYLRASETRRLTDRLRPLLVRAGVSVQDHGLGPDYWPSFVATVENALRLLEPATKETAPNL